MTTPSGLSLRVRLTALVVVLLGAGLIVSSLLATAALRGYLLDRVDEQLTAGARPFGTFPGQLPLPAPGEAETPRPPTRFYLAVIDATGSRVLFDPTDVQQAAPMLPDAAALESATTQPFTVEAVDGNGQWRMVVTPLAGQEGWAVGAYPLNDVTATVGRLVLLQGVVGILVVAIAGLVGYVLVRRSLQPLDEMAGTAHAIADGDLSLRVPASPTTTEVGQLAESFNAMVTRIEQSFDSQRASEAEARASEERMRRFIADAGHELRTPLTSIRGYAELIEQGAAADRDVAVARIQDEADRMGGLVDDLQLLARLDEQRPLRLEDVDLDEICAAAVAAARVSSPTRHITVWPGDSPATVRGEGDRLRQVMDNLLSNAIRYSPDATAIDVVIDRPEEEDPARAVRVSVVDRGPGLSPLDAAHVFDRLYRTDEARSRVDGGAGLGLAIVRSIVEAHGGAVFVRSRPGEGSKFGFTLPRQS